MSDGTRSVVYGAHPEKGKSEEDAYRQIRDLNAHCVEHIKTT